jgi:hypothetical protein
VLAAVLVWVVRGGSAAQVVICADAMVIERTIGQATWATGWTRAVVVAEAVNDP